MNRKNQHEWGFMGNDTKGRGDLAYCDLCKRWKWIFEPKKLFKLSSEAYRKMIDAGEIYGV